MVVDIESLFIFLECALLFIYACVYIHFRNAREHWKKLDIPTLASTAKYGNYVSTFFCKLETRKRIRLLYESFKGHGVGGLYTLGSPTLLVLDPLAIRCALRLERWSTAHAVRLTRRQEFSIKNLSLSVFETLVKCARELSQCLLDNGGTVEIHDVLERFTIDVTSGCVYGVPVSTLRHPTTELREICRSRDNSSSSLPVKDCLLKEVLAASARRVLHNEVSTTCLLQFFEGDEQALMEQAAVFLAGGQIVANTMALCVYELAHNPHLQERARSEVDRVLEQHGGLITQQSVEDLQYLHIILLETIRKYAPVAEIMRYCPARMDLPGCNVTIEGGTQVQIPVLGLHQDLRYFSEPDCFDPDRFRRATCFLPFGDGPGHCTGSEFALLQMKIGLVYILRNHFIYTSHKMPKYSADLVPSYDIWLTVARRDNQIK